MDAPSRVEPRDELHILLYYLLILPCDMRLHLENYLKLFSGHRTSFVSLISKMNEPSVATWSLLIFGNKGDLEP